MKRLAVALGAEVTDIRLAEMDAEMFAEVQAALLEHHVLFFPEQSLTQAEHVAVGRWFGRLEGHPALLNPYPDFPEIFELKASKGGIADEWHTDLTFLAQPSIMSILHMVQCPPVGGDTMWANTALAYEELSAPMRDMLDGLTALHDESPHGKPEVMSMHPAVRVHPVTGQRVLYVNTHFTRRFVELSHEESDVLLGYLGRWVSSERFTVRYRWTPGTIALWDNRCTQHFVVNDFVGERVIQRVTVMGDEPVGNPPRWEPHTAQRRGAASRHDVQLRRHLAVRGDGDGRS